MTQNTFQKLEKILKKDERLVSDDEKLLKNKAIELAHKLDKDLIEALADSKDLKKIFFKKVSDITIFDKDLFIEFVSNKEFLPDSYTAFKNKIGFSTNGEYLKQSKDITLVWPYKDCVLEGGQTKEDTKRKEIFWNTTLAPDEISRLLEPKALTNWKRYDEENTKTGHKVKEIKDTDNLIIKGNNLLALHSLKKRFAGKVKLIYIDPPYNTGNDSFNYNDSFNHSTWLTFMKNRLEVARDLLSDDGSIYVQLDYNEVHYAKILMDEVFGKNNLQREIIWNKGNMFGYAASADNFVLSHDSILFYTKSDKKIFNKIYESYSKEYIDQRFKHDDNDGKGRYRLQGKNQKQYLSDSAGVPMSDVWKMPVINVMAKEKMFDTQKPETLLKRIIEVSSKEGEIILDFFAGSGTSLAVAHKLDRQYVGIEQMDYIHDLPESRLKKVIEGEQGGISKDVKWKGGGSFIYTELMPLNEKYVREIRDAKTKKDIEKIWKEINKNGFLSYKIDPKKFNKETKSFVGLDLEDQKKFILESLDKNMLYVNYNDIDDKDYKVSKEDNGLNDKFYNK